MFITRKPMNRYQCTDKIVKKLVYKIKSLYKKIDEGGR